MGTDLVVCPTVSRTLKEYVSAGSLSGNDSNAPAEKTLVSAAATTTSEKTSHNVGVEECIKKIIVGVKVDETPVYWYGWKRCDVWIGRLWMEVSQDVRQFYAYTRGSGRK
jgi:hypothetical protein